MNWQSFIQLIQQGDASTHFFSNTKQPTLIGKTISALLNTHGGKLIIGYDKVNVHLTGFDQPDQWIEQFLETNFKQTDLTFSFLFRSNKKILMFDIEKSTSPVAFEHKYYQFNHQNIEEFTPTKTRYSSIINATNTTPSPSTNNQYQPKPTINNNANITQTPPQSQQIPQTPSQTPSQTSQYQPPSQEMQYQPPTNQETNYQPPQNTQPESNAHSPQHIEANSQSNSPLPTPPNQAQPIQKKDLHPRQVKALKYLTKNGSIKNKIYRKLFSVSHKTAHIELAELVTLGKIIISGSGRSTCYKLPEPTIDAISTSMQTINNNANKPTDTPIQSNTGTTDQTSKHPNWPTLNTYLTNNKKISETIYADEFNVDLANAIEDLQQLCNDGVIEIYIENNELYYIQTKPEHALA